MCFSSDINSHLTEVNNHDANRMIYWHSIRWKQIPNHENQLHYRGDAGQYWSQLLWQKYGIFLVRSHCKIRQEDNILHLLSKMMCLKYLMWWLCSLYIRISWVWSATTRKRHEINSEKVKDALSGSDLIFADNHRSYSENGSTFRWKISILSLLDIFLWLSVKVNAAFCR